MPKYVWTVEVFDYVTPVAGFEHTCVTVEKTFMVHTGAVDFMLITESDVDAFARTKARKWREEVGEFAAKLNGVMGGERLYKVIYGGLVRSRLPLS